MKIDRDQLQATVGRMKRDGYDYLVKITAVDYGDRLEAIYILRNIAAKKDEMLEVTLSPSDAWVPTIMEEHMSADWYEREMYEMFGIEINGRRARRLLLEKWDGIDPPLRKSFQWAAAYRTGDAEQK